MTGTAFAIAIGLVVQIVLTLVLIPLLDPLTGTLVFLTSLGALFIEVSLALEASTTQQVEDEAGDE
jgi:hypothetical protein